MKPAIDATPAMANRIVHATELNFCKCFLRKTAHGRKMSPRAIGQRLWPTGICFAVVAGTLTVSVTVVAPAPDGMLAGEKVAVAPVGRPVTAKLIAAGNVTPFGGLKISV